MNRSINTDEIKRFIAGGTEYPFEADWQQRQSVPLPQIAKPKAALPIGFHEIPPLVTGADTAPVKTKENAPAIPSANHRSITKTVFTDRDILQ